MNTKAAAMLLIACIASSVAVQADAPGGVWLWQREIAVEQGAGFNRLEIPAAVYEKAQLGLGDLRIVDDKGVAVPYILESHRQSSAMVDDAYTFTSAGDFRRRGDTVFDFLGQPPAGSDLIVNRLTVDSESDGDFFKYVELYGSHDSKHWEWLGHNSLYRVEGKAQRVLDLGAPQRYTAYRIVILDNAEGIRLSSLSGTLVSEAEVKATHQRTFTASQFQRQEVKSATVITLKGIANLPVRAVSIEAAGLFHRPTRVISGDIGAPAAVFGSGYLFQSTLKGPEPLRNSLPVEINRPMETLSLIIENGDNPPLEIQSVTLAYSADTLIFEAAPGKAYTLQYGNSEAPRPQYDLERFRGEIAQQAMGTASLGGETAAPVLEAPEAQGPGLKAVFSGMIFLMALVLAWLAIRGMKKPE